MDKKLKSRDIVERYNATVAFENSGEKFNKEWPRACWGAANAWLMLVGPSPGKEDDINDVWPGGPNRPIDEKVSISSNTGNIEFATNKGRNLAWLRLTTDLTGDEKYAKALTALCNLDWGHNPNQNAIPDEYLAAGCKCIHELIKETQPVIVAALTVRVWDHMVSYFQQFTSKPYDDTSLARKPLVILLDNNQEILLIKTRHPSRPIPIKEHEEYKRISAAVRNHQIL